MNTGRGEASMRIPTSKQLIEELVLANRILYWLGVLDAYGHVSARDPDRPEHFFLSRNLAPASVTADDVMLYDLDANPVGPPEHSMYNERFIHGQVYRARPDVHAVVHSHSPTVIPFGVSRTALRPIYHMASFIPQKVPVFEIRDAAGWTDLLIRNNDLGQALAKTLGQESVALMRGHGNVVVGSDLRYAVYRAYYTEINARLQLQSMSLEGSITFIAPEEAAMTNGGKGINPQRAWDMWVRAVSPSIR
jgi:ribulose-5-phosphate 4-epimerase/fuculose-1-phosphate aldolase